MKRKIICLTLVAIFVLVFSMNVFATNNNNTIPVEEDNDVLNEVFANYRLIDKESLVKDIIEMNKKYPEARLSVEEALEEYEKIAGLSVAEQIEYFKEINTGVPVIAYCGVHSPPMRRSVAVVRRSSHHLICKTLCREGSLHV